MRRAMPEPWIGPSASRVFRIIRARVPCQTSFLGGMSDECSYGITILRWHRFYGKAIEGGKARSWSPRDRPESADSAAEARALEVRGVDAEAEAPPFRILIAPVRFGEGAKVLLRGRYGESFIEWREGMS